MKRYLEFFRDIPRGSSLFSVFTLEWAMAVQNAIRALAQGENISTEGEVTLSPGDGKVRLGARRRFTPWGSSGGGSSSPCSFGTIIAIDDETAYTKGIRGGLIVCGDQNFNVNYQGLDTDPSTNGVWLVQITLSDIECATDDDGEIFLPGVVTSTGTPTWALVAWTDPTDYGSNTNPASPAAPTGSVVIPVGKLTITDGVPSLANVGCGTVTIGQCAGILSVSRA